MGFEQLGSGFSVDLTANLASAAPAFVLSQILENPEVMKLTQGASVQKIEETARYKCLGCYEFTISQNTPAGLQQIIVNTEDTRDS